MKYFLFIFVAGVAFSSCKKVVNEVPAYDQLNLAFNTKMGAVYDTTYINLKSRFPINQRNFQSSLIYQQISDTEVNVTILTAHNMQTFNLQWYTKDDALAYFSIYKKETQSKASYGN
jgi:hypothetical protein